MLIGRQNTSFLKHIITVFLLGMCFLSFAQDEPMTEIIVSGFVLNQESFAPVETKIIVKKFNTHINVLITFTNKESGRYVFALESGKYNIVYEAKGFLFQSEFLDLSNVAEFRLEKKVYLLPINSIASDFNTTVIDIKEEVKREREITTDVESEKINPDIVEATNEKDNELDIKEKDVKLVSNENILIDDEKQVDKEQPNNDNSKEDTKDIDREQETISKDNNKDESNIAISTNDQPSDDVKDDPKEKENVDVERERMLPIIIRNNEQLLDAKTVFQTNKTVLNKPASSDLDKVYTFLKDNNNIKLMLRGYGEMGETSSEAMQLGFDRAKSVQDYLLNKGIDSDRLYTTGETEGQAILSNNTLKIWRSMHNVECLIISDKEILTALESNPNGEPKKERESALLNTMTYDNKDFQWLNECVVFFDKKESELSLNYYLLMDSVQFLLEEYPEVKIEIIGFVAKDESKKLLNSLSYGRAYSVSGYLTDNGIDERRIKLMSSRLYSAAGGNKSMDLGRRVEFSIALQEEALVYNKLEVENDIPEDEKKDEIEVDHPDDIIPKEEVKSTEKETLKEEIKPKEEVQAKEELVVKEEKDPKEKEFISPVTILKTESDYLNELLALSGSVKNSRITYKVQVGAYSRSLPPDAIIRKVVLDVTEEKLGDGFTRYVTISYQSIAEADKRKKSIRQNIPDAYLVAYIDGKRSKMKNVYELLNQ